MSLPASASKMSVCTRRSAVPPLVGREAESDETPLAVPPAAIPPRRVVTHVERPGNRRCRVTRYDASLGCETSVQPKSTGPTSNVASIAGISSANILTRTSRTEGMGRPLTCRHSRTSVRIGLWSVMSALGNRGDSVELGVSRNSWQKPSSRSRVTTFPSTLIRPFISRGNCNSTMKCLARIRPTFSNRTNIMPSPGRPGCLFTNIAPRIIGCVQRFITSRTS
jgi:hypothetical protein